MAQGKFSGFARWAFGLAAACAILGCQSWRVSGQSQNAGGEEPGKPNYKVGPDSGTVQTKPDAILRPMSESELSQVRYYSDLGPDTIDVSSYPARQRANFAVARYACSQCHTLARVVNAPVVSRRLWEFYVLGMRFRAHFQQDKRMSKDDIEAIVDFLEFDSQARKLARRSRFDAEQDALKEAYSRLLSEKMKGLQQGPQPRIITPP